MERLTSQEAVPAALRGGIVALGNFDGFHLGHQAVAGRAIARACAEGRPAIVLTFDPHPRAFLAPGTPPFLLTRIDQRLDLFAAAGADAGLVMRFDGDMAALGPEEFFQRWLIEHIDAAGVVTGADFAFGRGGAGGTALLAGLAAGRGIATETVAPVLDGGAAVSSSRVRRALVAADPDEAARLLTRPFAVRGTVVHGDKRGREIGYPTANVEMGGYQRPAYGIYAVRGRLADGRVLNGAANLGVRPQFDPPKELLEPYFFDFAEDLYGQEIEVELVRFLRAEARYEGMDALTAQMARDCDEARAFLARPDGVT